MEDTLLRLNTRATLSDDECPATRAEALRACIAASAILRDRMQVNRPRDAEFASIGIAWADRVLRGESVRDVGW